MSVRLCQDCGAELSAGLGACPSCGRPIRPEAQAGEAFGSPIDSPSDSPADAPSESPDVVARVSSSEHGVEAPPVESAAAASRRGPICPVHDGPANGTCKRCGTFLCELCRRREGQELCPSCDRGRRPRPTFPLSYQSATFLDMWRHGSVAFQKQWLTLSAAALLAISLPIGVLFGVAMGAGCLMVIPLALFRGNGGGPPGAILSVGFIGLYMLAYLIAGLVGVALQFRLAALALRAARGQSAPLMMLFQDFGKGLRAGPMVFIAFGIPYILIAGLSMAISEEVFIRQEQPIFFVLLFAAGMLLYLPQVIYTLHELTENRRVGSFGTLLTAHQVVRGDRARTCGGCAFMTFLILLGAVIFCIGAAPALALAHCVFATFYLTLRQKRGMDETS